MTDLIIVCAGGFGREAMDILTSYVEDAHIWNRPSPYRLLGFIDDDPHALDGTGVQYPILGSISEWKPIGGERYVLGSSSPGTKRALAEKLGARGCQFETLVAPWSRVSPNAELGEGCLITAYRVCGGAKLGRFVNAAGSMICPGAVIGDFSTATGFTVVEAAKVGKSVFMGSHAVVCAGVTVGDGANVSAGSIVTKDVRAGATVFGCPAEELQV